MSRRLTESEYLLIIELADDWSKDGEPTSTHQTDASKIEARAEAFAQAYKAIIKTVTAFVPED